MQRLISLMGLGLSLWLGTALPTLAKRVHPAIVRNIAFPAHVNVPFATYRLEIEMGSSPVEQFVIGLPKNVRVTSGIVVEDPNGIVIPAKVSFQGQQAILQFERPLQPNSKVSIDLNGVRNSLRSSQTMDFPMFAKEPGQAQLVQFGTAHIKVKLP